MFGFNGNNNNAKMPKQGHTTITPNNYGYSHTFIDDDSQMVLEWEQNGCLPTPEPVSYTHLTLPTKDGV